MKDEITIRDLINFGKKAEARGDIETRDEVVRILHFFARKWGIEFNKEDYEAVS